MKKLMMVAVALCVVVSTTLSADMFGYGGAGMRLQLGVKMDPEIKHETSNNIIQESKTEAFLGYWHGYTSWWGLHFKGEFMEGKLGAEHGTCPLELWGKANFADGISLTVGQNASTLMFNRNGAIFNSILGEQVSDLRQWATVGTAEEICNPWPGRYEMMVLQIKKFQLGIVNTDLFRQVLEPGEHDKAVKEQKTKFILPRIEAIFNHGSENFFINVGGGVQMYKYTFTNDTGGSVTKMDTVDMMLPSFQVALQTGFMAGPLDATFRGMLIGNSGLWFQSWQTVGGYAGGAWKTGRPVIDSSDAMKMNLSIYGYANFQIKAIDNITPSVGVGFVGQKHTCEREIIPVNKTKAEAVNGLDPALYFFGNCVFGLLNNGFQIKPEVGFLYHGNNYVGVPEYNTLAINVTFQTIF